MGSEYICANCLQRGEMTVTSSTQCSLDSSHVRFIQSFTTGDPSPDPPAKYWLMWCSTCGQHYAYNQQAEPILCPLSHIPTTIDERTTCPSCKETISPNGTKWKIFIADDGGMMTAKVVE